MCSISKDVLLIVSLLCLVHSTPVQDGNNDRIGCLKCHNIDKNKINVHLVPHSHDDVGWLKTLDQYYYGLNNSIQRASVQYIITSVVNALSDNPDRRFIQVETAFFWKWWKDQSESMRKRFKTLVDNGQIEMVNGAWSMNDEACVNYQSTVDQFTWGLRLLKDTVGSCGIPRVGWQIDPFGHSREQASIFAQLGYDGVFFARLDHEDKATRQKNKSLDFAWQSSANIANKTIFGGIFTTSLYYPPDGFCWDYECGDDAIDDDPKSGDYNLEKKVKIFSNMMRNYSEWYPTKNILIPMGGDFHYSVAEANFINMDKLLRALKNDSELNVFYSTPSCYIKAVNEAKPNLKLKVDDFFPYSNDEHSFWTGYFSSRPTTKRFERLGHNILQVLKQLYALNSAINGKNYEDGLTDLREAMGTFQHHDAITGTEKQHVAKDYVRLLTRAIEEAEKPVGEIVRNFIPLKNVTLDLSSCLLSNISICTSQDSERLVVLVYNPLTWPVNHHVRLPVEATKITVRGSNGSEKCDIVPNFGNFSFVKLTRQPSSHELVFTAKEVPALGFKLYYVDKNSSEPNCKILTDVKKNTFGTKESSFTINSTTNLLQSVTLNGKTVGITQNFFYYNSETGIKDKTKIASGAYLFRPTSDVPSEVSDEVVKLNAFSGDVVDEYHQTWNTKIMDIKQSIRVYKDEGYVEFDWIVGDITIGDNTTGKEVITKFTVTDSFDNKNVFYTDSNGREMIKRSVNQRLDYDYNATIEPVASNYYPVTSKIVIKDEKENMEVAVLNDRSQGGSSLGKGEIELMVHRRLFKDDNKGVGESLNETEFGSGLYVRGSHYLVLGQVSGANKRGRTTAAEDRILAQQKLLQPWVGVAPTNDTFEQVENVIKEPFETISTDSLPPSINILTLEPWHKESYLLRLEHFLEKDEDPKLSSQQTVDLQKLFKNIQITDLEETTLGGNQLMTDFEKRDKYAWYTEGPSLPVVPKGTDQSKFKVSLSPMEIRTFIVRMEKTPASSSNIFKPVYSLVVVLFFVTFFHNMQ